jgi:hypothetical protein
MNAHFDDEGRLLERVTYQGVTFRGARFGLTPGCWVISAAAARKILKACDREPPCVGYDVSLQTEPGSSRPSFRYFMCHYGGGRFRISLADGYTHVYWSDDGRTAKKVGGRAQN